MVVCRRFQPAGTTDWPIETRPKLTLVGAKIHESNDLDFAVSLPRHQSDELTVKYVGPVLSGCDIEFTSVIP